MQDSKKGYMPMNHGAQLSKTQCPSTTDERSIMSRVPYASAIGSIMCVMLCTRPDISYALSVTSRYQANPGMEHWNAAKNILKYLRRTKDIFLVYGGDSELVINDYTKSKHVLRRYHLIREIVNRGDVKICRVDKVSNTADPLTKPLPQAKHQLRAASMCMRHIGDWL